MAPLHFGCTRRRSVTRGKEFNTKDKYTEVECDINTEGYILKLFIR